MVLKLSFGGWVWISLDKAVLPNQCATNVIGVPWNIGGCKVTVIKILKQMFYISKIIILELVWLPL